MADMQRLRRRVTEEAVEFIEADLVKGRSQLRDIPRQAVSSTWGAGNVAVRRVRSMANIAFGRYPQGEVPVEELSADPAERFKQVQAAYGTDDRLAVDVQDNKFRLFILFMAIAVGIVAINIATWRSYLTNPLLVMGQLAPLLPALGSAVSCAFTNWQMRTRRLGSFREFMHKPAEWWPVPSDMSAINGSAKSVATIVLVVSAVAVASIMGTAPDAQAAPGVSVPNLFQALGPGDLWNHLLSFVFPGIGPVKGPATPLTNAVTSAFATTISVLMACGGAYMAFQLVTATISVSHSGDALSGRSGWHSFWAPLRVCYGFASLVPVFNGWCLLQVAVVWVSVVSGQAGNIIWSSFVTNLQAKTITQPNLPQTVGLVHDVMGLELCNSYLTADRARKMAANPGANIPANTRQAPTLVGWLSQDMVWDYGACGKIKSTLPSPSTETDAANFATAKRDALTALRDDLKPVADAIVLATMPGTGSGTDYSNQWQKVIQAKAKYDNALVTGAGAYVAARSNNSGLRRADNSPGNSADDFITVLSQQGWASAGSAYMAIARLNARQVAMMREMPVVTTEGPVDANTVSKIFDGFPKVVESFQTFWKTNVTTEGGTGLDYAARTAAINAMRVADMHQADGSLYNSLQYLFSTDSGIQKGIMNLSSLKPDEMDGLQEMVNLGDTIIGASEAAITVMVGFDIFKAINPEARLATVASKALSAGSSAFSYGTMFMMFIMSAVFFAGVYDSLVLPMLPYFYFLFATMGILITVCEGVIAAPIWAFMHIRLDGEGFSEGPQKAGYQILFSLLFKIPLTLFGLFFSLLVFNAMVWLMGMTFYPAIAGATAQSLFGFVGVVVMVIMITTINYQIANRSFHLITAVPDKVMSWFGVHGGGDESHGATTIVGNVSGSAKGAFQQLEGKMGGAFAAGKQRRADNRRAGLVDEPGGGNGGGDPPPPPPL